MHAYVHMCVCVVDIRFSHTNTAKWLEGREKFGPCVWYTERVEKTRDTAKDTQREKATLPNAFLYNNIAYSIRTCDDDIRKCEHLYLLSLFFIHIIIFGRFGFLGSRMNNKPKSYACMMVRTLRLRSRNIRIYIHLVCVHDDCRRQRHRHRWWCSSYNLAILASRCRHSLLRLLLLVRLLHSFNIEMRLNISAQQRTAHISVWLWKCNRGKSRERENERKKNSIMNNRGFCFI